MSHPGEPGPLLLVIAAEAGISRKGFRLPSEWPKRFRLRRN